MNILIDADGCPVVDLTLQIAKRFVVPVIILCDTSHQIEREGAQTLVFDINEAGSGMAGLWQCVSMMPYPQRQGGRAMFRQKRMDRRIKFICPFDLAEHQGVEPWHRSPGLSHFECDLLRPLE